MERRNYLIEDLTEEERKYINAIIWNTARDCKKNNYKRNRIESISIFDEKIEGSYLSVEDSYSFFNEDLIGESFEFKAVLKPLSIAEQYNMVKQLDNLAKESDLYIYIKQLTFKEKLIVFLLFIKGYKVNKIAKLLNISRYSVNYRTNCIKAKFKIVKGLIDNEERNV